MTATVIDRQELNRLLANSPSLPQTPQFWNRCSITARALLNACQWRLTDVGETWWLAIACPTADTTWQALHDLDALIDALRPLAPHARISVYPPETIGNAFVTDLDDPWGYATSPWDEEQDI
ncbi:MAG: hypothetical protein HC838_06690 [Spirulinaceae cyanobacterium RM2_2_10]|nr:hypothetical protein [Spirulinaceae cyanobacterium SM2_1_0]NJO19809.1 hypothetical protein [Spirulinaceae cyanobacterium RM2_2_10]